MISVQFNGRFPQQRKIETYCCDILNFFFKREIKRKILVEITCRRHLVFDHELRGRKHFPQDGGQCWVDDNAKGVSHIQVEIARNYMHSDKTLEPHNIEEIVSTLAHELTHVKQLIRGELGVRFGTKKHNGISEREIVETLPHSKWPWEKEAYFYEKYLSKTLWH